MGKTDNRYQPLFNSFHIGKEEIRNRFIMGPMGMAWFNDAQAAYTDEAIAFYETRAKGGFGAIITGVNLVDQVVDPPMGAGVLIDAPEHFIVKGRELASAVGAYGTKMFLELGFGVGRNYPTFKAPSALPAFNYPVMVSEPLTKEEIAIKRDAVIKGAVIGQQAGFAGVDLHSLHWGYLLDQFVLSITNQREDEYGGSLDNRLRLVRETVEGIHRECGEDYPVIIGLGVKSYIKALNQASLFGEDEAGRTVEEAVEIAKKLEEMGIAAIMCDTGIYDSFYYACPPSYLERGHGLKFYKQIKDAVSVPVMARSRMGSADLCLSAIENGQADAVVLARPSLADPDFPNKIASGNADKIRPCISCNLGCIARCLETREHETCAANPRACFEYSHPEKTADDPKKIAVVGGGVAGMQACITADDCGHTAELFEKSSVLGGELNAAGAHESKKDIHELRDWFIGELDDRHIPVRMNTEFTAELCEEGGYDVVVMATGASSLMPASIPGMDKAISAVELLETEPEIGESAIVVGGGMVGCETAVDLAKKGKKVTIVEMLPDVLSGEFVPQQHKMMLRDMIAEYGITVCAANKLAEITDEGVIVESVAEENAGSRTELKADQVVISMGLRPVTNIKETLEEKGVKVLQIGSAKRVGNVLTATQDAFETIYNL